MARSSTRDASTSSLTIESHMNLISLFFFFVSMFFGKAIKDGKEEREHEHNDIKIDLKPKFHKVVRFESRWERTRTKGCLTTLLLLYHDYNNVNAKVQKFMLQNRLYSE